MTFEFKKTIELNGEVWYKVYVDDWPIRCLCENTNANAAEEMRKFYTDMVMAAKKGLPHTEILDSQTILSSKK